MEAGQFEHGTSSGYGYHRCRCDECLTWHRAYKKLEYQRNKDKLLARNKEYREANKEQLAEKAAQRYRDNIEYWREYHRRYQQENKEKVNAKNKRWRAENPDKHHAWQAIDRERRKAAQWDEEAKAWFDSLVDPECAYCGAPAEVADHVIPISKGGTGVRENLAPACRNCNTSKAALGMAEFLRRMRRRSG